MNCYLASTQSWATTNWMWNQTHYWCVISGPMETIWLWLGIYREFGWWGTAVWGFWVMPPEKELQMRCFSCFFKLFTTSIFIANPSSDIFVASFTELHVTHISVCALKSVWQKAVAIMPYTESGSTATWPEQCLMWQIKHQICWNMKPVVTVMNVIHWLWCLSPIHPVALCRAEDHQVVQPWLTRGATLVGLQPPHYWGALTDGIFHRHHKYKVSNWTCLPDKDSLT